MGTVTVNCVVVAAVTVAFVAPKKTMLLAGVALKLVPEIVTDVPMGPLAGLKDVITGTCACVLNAISVETRHKALLISVSIQPQIRRSGQGGIFYLTRF